MPKIAKSLSPLEIRRITKPGFTSVGTVPGLALQVSASGAKSWVLRIVVGGKRRDMGLGGYPGLTVADAFEAARKARTAIAEGIDPITQRKAAKSAIRAAQAQSITFAGAARAYIACHRAGWSNAKHAQQWENTLSTYAFPKIGSMLVGDVALPHVLSIVEPLWQEKTETASRVRNRIELILDWAAARKYRSGENPARWRGHLDKLLPKPTKIAKPVHFAALPIDGMSAFVAELRAASGVGAKALEFAILTGGRSGEVRGATWSEIDFINACWTIPAARMKAKREHRVPLAEPAVSLLQSIPSGTPNDLIFRGSNGRPLSDMTLSAVLRRMKVDAVPHGFRSTFRDWASERTAYPHEVCEMALAHTIGNKAEAAYRRGDLFEKRRRMMHDWAAFIGQPAQSATVIGIRSVQGL